MNSGFSPWRTVRFWLPALSAALLLHTSRAGVQEAQAPDPLWNIGTGEEIPGTDVLATKEFGAIVVRPPANGELDSATIIGPDGEDEGQGNLRAGDIILGADGMRVYGSREFQLARFRNPLSTTMDLLINRAGSLDRIKVRNLQPGRDLGVAFDTGLEEDRFLEGITRLGIDLKDDATRAALVDVPEEAAADLSHWAANHPNDDTAWIKDYIDLYMAVQRRQYAKANNPAHQPPTPYFSRLEKFYLNLAKVNQPKEVEPDLAASGENAEFYALSLPTPDFSPPFGNVNFSDKRFAMLLRRRYDLGDDQHDPELTAAAAGYAPVSGSSGLDNYVNQERGALIDAPTQGGWVLHAYMVQKPAGRNLLMAALANKLKEKSEPDWVIDAYALIPLKLAARDTDGIPELIAGIGAQSPYLALREVEAMYGIRHGTRPIFAALEATKPMAEKYDAAMGPSFPAIFHWANAEVYPVASQLGLYRRWFLQRPCIPQGDSLSAGYRAERIAESVAADAQAGARRTGSNAADRGRCRVVDGLDELGGAPDAGERWAALIRHSSSIHG